MQNGERYIVVEDGKPEYVLMRFEDYVGLAAGKRASPGHGNPGQEPAGGWQSVNAVLEEVHGHDPYASSPNPEPRPAAADPTTIRLEDLPL